MTIYSLVVLLPQFWTSPLFMFNSNCCFFTHIKISQEAGQVVWYSHLLKNFPQFIVIHTVKGFSIVNEAETDVFLQSACFLHDPVNVGNLISGSSASSKPSLYIWNFSVHILMKSSLKDFELYLLACEMSATVVWIFFGTAFLWDWNENWLFQSSGHCWGFQICWHIECSTLIALSFRILNNSTGILSWFEVQEMCAGYVQIPASTLYKRLEHPQV